MAIDRSNIPSNKVYEKHSPGVLLTSLLGFAIVGLLALTFVMPIVAYFPNGEERVDMNALNLIFYSLRYFLNGGYNANFDRFASNVSGYSGQITIFHFLAENQMMAELIISGLLAISVIFAVVVLLYSLAFLFRGHMKSTLMISAISHSVASFYSFFLGLLFLYFFVCNKMFKETNIFESVRFYIAPFFIMIAMIAIAFILSSIYNLCFRRRVYIKNYKPRITDDPSLKDTPVYKYVSNFPNGTNEVMDNAFNGEQEIEEAIIPNCIVRLGNNAFSYCLKLSKVVIPTSVKQIGNECFLNCQNLKRIVYKGTLNEWKSVSLGNDWNKGTNAPMIEVSDGKEIIR